MLSAEVKVLDGKLIGCGLMARIGVALPLEPPTIYAKPRQMHDMIATNAVMSKAQAWVDADLRELVREATELMT
jgi:hypothetical protein